MKLIAVDNISVRYGHHLALKNVSLCVSPGEIVTIVGPNGSGKTSLLRAIIGAIRPDTGTITRKPGLVIGNVPQRLHIDRTLPMTVERFIRLTDRGSRGDCVSALRRVSAPNLLTRQLSQLSGGQFQRVLLARALANQPDILLLDEAAQGLDQPGSATFYQLIDRVRLDTGCAILMVSHELHVVMSASDRVVCLNTHVCCEGTPARVASAPEYRALFGSHTKGALALYRHDHDHLHDHQDDESCSTIS
ncbi:MAG: metal ABC transporter ATP-binding protein [Rhodobacteraceae bacterium]|nr:metal ABC transporter ATP-binding protein [Paracoccaceae bacterium]